MSEEPSNYAAAGLAGNRVARGFIAALFTAGVSIALVNLFAMVDPGQQPYLFALILAVGFVGAQIQERMRRMAG